MTKKDRLTYLDNALLMTGMAIQMHLIERAALDPASTQRLVDAMCQTFQRCAKGEQHEHTKKTAQEL